MLNTNLKMTKFLIDKITKLSVFLPKQIELDSKKGNLVITIENKVLFITDDSFTDISSNYNIAIRDN
jgi:hypothetical protein